ncbi:MAG: RelA/SpoT family protein [Bacteroidia bacterium]|nr:bifunctional (p)ppGpp synthetase/guanosine-3',5'-bis(diphosphate) 3'-pyrophosphohydrolase [Bacteroidia bacterium]MCO5252840.1 RelA/SpoT family protein [Bacteroidota bacterium]MCZ2128736.1 RelA/SpoT family protein [Bacteroidia bacterium]
MSKEISETVTSKLNQEDLENKEIINRYRRLLRSIRFPLKKEDKKLIREAFNLALDAHRGVRRKSGVPYIFHPIEVARIAAKEIGLGATSIACALIHDVVEDSDYSLEYIEKKFGKKVAQIVDGLTKISGVFDYADSMQAENFRKMLLTLSKDVRVIIIKLCDRLHNMRTLESMSRKNQLKIASETLFFYAPLAHRLGLYAMKTELEDLAVKFTERQKYNEITTKLRDTKASRDRYMRKFADPIKTVLDKHGVKYEVKGRVKSVYSILHKMEKQQVPFEEVYDLFAVRIIIDTNPTNEKADCWKVYSFVTDIYYPNPTRLRDWISQPKSNGYESLHTTVMGPGGQWVEVQIRSTRMDEVAEQGYAAHWKYKNQGAEKEGGRGLDEWLLRVKDVLENPGPNALDFLDQFKSQLLEEEIFVFTPRGELRKMPAGSTALDFAFEIHSEIGIKCIGAKVNNKLVQLKTPLANGDQVEILTSDKQVPKEEWFGYLVSGKAKNKLKDYFNDAKKRDAEHGKEILKRKFKTAKITFSDEHINRLVDIFKLHSATDLFASVGLGLISKDEIDLKKNLAKKTKHKQAKVEIIAPIVTFPDKNTNIIVGDTPELEYKLAQCCNPIPGDDIFGFVTVGEGIKIHRTNCSNGIALMSNYGYRVIKAEWEAQYQRSEKQFLVGLKIEGIDDVGVLSSLTDIISKAMKVNIKSITVESNAGTFEGRLLLYITDTKHLDELISNIVVRHKFMKVTRVDVKN